MNIDLKEKQEIETKQKNSLSYTISFTPEMNAKIKKLCIKTGHQTISSLIRSLLIQEIDNKEIK